VSDNPIHWTEPSGDVGLEPLLAEAALAMAMLTALPVQMAVLDAEGRIRYVNQTWKELALAFAGQENLGKVAEGASYLDVCRHAEEGGDKLAAEVRRALEAILHGKLELFTQEYKCRRTAEAEAEEGEEWEWYLLYAAPLQTGGAVVAHIDITERKLEEQELGFREERQRLILGSTSDLISTHTADSTFVFASDSALALLGCEPEELVGRRLLELIHPDDQEGAVRAWDRLFSGSTQETFTVRLERRDERHVWVETSCRTLIRGSQAPGELFVAVSRDVTEHKEAEERQAELRLALERAAFEWRSTFDEIQLPILLLGLDGRIRRLNRAATDLFGRNYRDAMGRTIDELGSGQPWQAVAAVAGRALEGFAPEICEARDEGTGRTWEVEASLAAPGDEEARLIVQVREITETVRLQDSLRRSETMAVLGSVVGGVAHEVRNPLFVMSSVLDAFENRFGDRPEFRPYLPMLRSELSRMTELMQSLRDFGKPARLEPLPGDLLHTVREAFALCRPLAEQHQVKLVAEGGTGSNPVPFDHHQLAQALKNVIENAVQHAPDGSSVVVTVAPFSHEGAPWVRLTICDRGPGFSAADLPKVTEPFFSRRKGGTGLGLAIVSRIIEGHDGRLRLGNRLDGGAEVEIALPALDHADH
jgi:PAS domain S-box-containing protein